MKIFFKLSLYLFLLLGFHAISVAENDSRQDDFLRIVKSPSGDLVALETAIVKFSNNRSEVDLFSALHVADSSYYQELNKQFRGYDAVLFELVTDEADNLENRLSKQEQGFSLANIQVGLSKALGLSFQLSEIDYSQSNFVHADFSPQEFSSTMEKRGESFISMFLKIFAASQKHSQTRSISDDISEFKLLYLLLGPSSPQKELELRRAFAEQFKNVDFLLGELGGEEGSTILTARNDKALSVLKGELLKGKKKMAIFYGGAHLPDMAKKLEKDFGMKYKDTNWIEAWNLRDENH